MSQSEITLFHPDILIVERFADFVPCSDFRWQSTTSFLKDPPAEYAEKIQPAIDILGGLEKIKSKVEKQTYTNEFEVTTACLRVDES